MATTSPINKLIEEVKAALGAEFDPSELTVVDGRLHEAYRPAGVPVAALYPVEEAEAAVSLLQDSAVAVQVFLPWELQREPQRIVDPAPVGDLIHRIRTRLYSTTHPYMGSAELWDLRLARVDYQADPVGNITRATAIVAAYGQNLAETTA
jgi:hypothetical protein